MKFHILFLAITCFLSLGNLRAEEDSVGADAEAQISRGSSSFSLELIKNLLHGAKEEDNILVSPFNIYLAMMMVMVGANGVTRDEMAGVLGVSKNVTTQLQVLKQIQFIIDVLENPDKSKHTYRKSQMKFASGMFVQKNYPILKSYVETLKTFFNAEAHNLDISGDAQNSTDFINKFISEATKGRIPKLFGQPLEPTTELVLANTVYFKGGWYKPFPKYKTTTAKFNTGVKEIDVPMMSHQTGLPYRNDSSLQFESIALPYDISGDTSMVIILPYKSQTLANLTKYLQPDTIHRSADAVTYDVECKIPKMKFSYSKSLVGPLSMQGLKNLFVQPDLRNMTEANDLRVSDILHAAEIEVNEDGTEASAVTITMFSRTAHILAQDPTIFVVDRPFLMAVYRLQTSSILFIGLVHKPNADKA